jgi:DNA invertase Pin-like site-specific DNA recombinase
VSILYRLANTGCDLHDDCTTCPFERCVYEDKEPQVDAQERYRQIADRRRQGVSLRDLAIEFGVSESTVDRAIREDKRGHLQH